MSEYNLKNKSFFKYDGIVVSSEQHQKVSDGIVVEAALQININGISYTVVMRTPGDDIELIRGLLYAEDIYRGITLPEFHIVEELDNGFTIIDVIIPESELGKGYLNKRTLLSVSSCGICGKQELEHIELSGESLQNKNIPNFETVRKMASVMASKQEVFKHTGGCHATAIFNKDYQFLVLKEDIGRHNALDKTVGHLIDNNQLNEAHCMLVSGRVSYEIVSKAFFAKIPIIIAVSACSSLAIDYAKEFGICLIGFSREDKLTVYAQPKN